MCTKSRSRYATILDEPRHVRKYRQSGERMESTLNRRGFLRHSGFWTSSFLACSILLDRSANAAPVRIDAQTVDQLTIRQITDGSHDVDLAGAELRGLTVERTGFPLASQGKTLEAEWGLALHLEFQARTGDQAIFARFRVYADHLPK